MDKWFIAAFLPLAILLIIELSRHLPTMNSLEVAGVLFNIFLTFGLLAIYLEMSDTQDQQREIVDKQENLMAANHAPRIRVYHHDVHQTESGETSLFVIRNEGEGPAENLKTECQIYLAEDAEPLPFLTSVESFNIRCFPRPLVKLAENESLVELSGSTWLGQFETAAFHAELMFYEMDFKKMASEALSQSRPNGGLSKKSEGGYLSYNEVIDKVPIDAADMVYFQFCIQYEYADGRQGRKEAPIYAVPPEKAEESGTLSEAVDNGDWIPYLPTGFRSAE